MKEIEDTIKWKTILCLCIERFNIFKCLYYANWSKTQWNPYQNSNSIFTEIEKISKIYIKQQKTESS